MTDASEGVRVLARRDLSSACFVDGETGKVASAKFPRKWPTLFDHRAAFVNVPRPGEPPPVRITLPDGRVVSSEEEGLDRILSADLGRDVALAKTAPPAPSLEEYWPDIEGLAHREAVTDEAMPPGTFFDIGVVHVLTTATLDRLRQLSPESRFEVRRFRPNIVVAPTGAGAGFIENDWVGRMVVIGDDPMCAGRTAMRSGDRAARAPTTESPSPGWHGQRWVVRVGTHPHRGFSRASRRISSRISGSATSVATSSAALDSTVD